MNDKPLLTNNKIFFTQKEKGGCSNACSIQSNWNTYYDCQFSHDYRSSIFSKYNIQELANLFMERTCEKPYVRNQQTNVFVEHAYSYVHRKYIKTESQ